MVTTVMGFLRIFQDAGVTLDGHGAAAGDYPWQSSSLFWVNVGVGGVITLLVAASAPGIAWFYYEPQLVGITLVLSTTFLIASSTVQHVALLNRQMRFGAIAMIDTVSMLAGYLTGTAIALLGYGYWALVGASVIQLAIRFVFGLVGFRVATSITIAQHSNRASADLRTGLTAGTLMVGWPGGLGQSFDRRFFGAAAVGLYSRASILLIRPLQQFMQPINTVVIPALSRVELSMTWYRRAFLQVFETIALLSFVLTGLLLALAHPLTLVVLCPKWEAAAVIFRIFPIAALASPPTSRPHGCSPAKDVGRTGSLRVRSSRLSRFARSWSVAIRAPRCSDILFGLVCPNTGAICLGPAGVVR